MNKTLFFNKFFSMQLSHQTHKLSCKKSLTARKGQKTFRPTVAGCQEEAPLHASALLERPTSVLRDCKGSPLLIDSQLKWSWNAINWISECPLKGLHVRMQTSERISGSLVSKKSWRVGSEMHFTRLPNLQDYRLVLAGEMVPHCGEMLCDPSGSHWQLV